MRDELLRLFESSPIPMWIFDTVTLGVLGVNDAAVRQYGYSREEFLNLSVLELRPPEGIPALLDTLVRSAQAGDETFAQPWVWRHRRKDGCLLDVETAWIPVTFDGRAARIVFSHDITKRTQAEQALRESEERFRQLADSIREVFWMSRPDTGEIIYVSPGYRDVWGRDPESVSSATLLETVYPADRERIVDALAKQMSGDFDEEFQIMRPDGSLRWIRARAFPVHNEQGEVYRLAGISEDITERKQAEEETRRSQEQLRALTVQLNRQQERASAWVAREIHDELGQALTGLKIHLVSLQKQIAALAPPGDVVERMRAMSQLVTATIESVRRISSALRPALLDDLGLTAAIKWQALEFEARTGIRCKFTAGRIPGSLDPEVSTAFFRIFQEALTNVARHAQASSVHIALYAQNDGLTLEVADDGKGISEAERLGPNALGLLGMRERVQLLSGRITVSGVPGRGTTVTATVPLSGANAQKTRREKSRQQR